MGGDEQDWADECADGAAGVDCAAVFEKLDLILDRELPASELDTMQGHLRACLPCTDRAEFERRIRAIVRDGCADTAPPALVSRIRDMLQLPSA